MIPELQSIALLLRANHALFRRALQGIDEAKAREPMGTANPPLWIAAHLVAVRSQFVRALGGTVDVPWAGLFPRGGEVANPEQWPSLAEILARADETHAALIQCAESCTVERLAERSGVLGLDKTVHGAFGLAVFHEAYHLGQLALGRRHQGLDRLVG